MTTIHPFAFARYKGEGFVIPETVTRIEDCAFSNCTELETEEYRAIVLPTNLDYIGKFAFEDVTIKIDTTQLTKLTNIGEYAFAYYLGDSFEFPSCTKRIEKHAFEGCTMITTLKVPKLLNI